jgi:Trk K+ transport system NAD-binding subunit
LATRPHAGSPGSPLDGYEILEIAIAPDSPAIGRRLSQLQWPPESFVAAVRRGDDIAGAQPDVPLGGGDPVILLAP